MSPQLPPRPHLDVLKKQAKALLDGHRSGDAEAVQRVSALADSLPPGASQDFSLRHAQQVLAREYGFSSWQALTDEVNGPQDDWVVERLAFYGDLAASLADSQRAGSLSTYGVLGDEMARQVAAGSDPDTAARAAIAQWAGCRDWGELGRVAGEGAKGTGAVTKDVLSALERMHEGLAGTIGKRLGGEAQIAFVDYTTICELVLSLARPSRSYRCSAQGIEGPFVIDVGPRLAAGLTEDDAGVVEQILQDLVSMWRPVAPLQSPSTQAFTDPFALQLGPIYGTCLLVAYEIEAPAGGLLSVAYPEASIPGLVRALGPGLTGHR